MERFCLLQIIRFGYLEHIFDLFTKFAIAFVPVCTKAPNIQNIAKARRKVLVTMENYQFTRVLFVVD
jgi:hypothetical protein